MRITRVQIGNFRGIQSLDLEFTNPAGKPLDLVVLAGPNCCGKTTVLEACLAALDRGFLARQKWDDAQAIHLGAEGWDIHISGIVPPGKFLSEMSYKKGWIKPKGKGTTYGNKEIYSVMMAAPLIYLSSWRASKLPGPVYLTVGKRGRKPAETEEGRLKRIKEYLINYQAEIAFNSVYENISSTIFNQPIYTTNPYEQINETWAFFYPERRMEFVPKKILEEQGIRYDLFAVDKETGAEIPVDSLSSGEIEIFTTLGSLAMERHSKNLDEGIVFIDEPELHLHPSWHRVFLRALRTMLPKTQFICATHSPEILDSVYSYERFTLLPEGDPRLDQTGAAGDGEV
jgi:energy-coupling factor transporter ATP-binding protein EcfA2